MYRIAILASTSYFSGLWMKSNSASRPSPSTLTPISFTLWSKSSAQSRSAIRMTRISTVKVCGIQHVVLRSKHVFCTWFCKFNTWFCVKCIKHVFCVSNTWSRIQNVFPPKLIRFDNMCFTGGTLVPTPANRNKKDRDFEKMLQQSMIEGSKPEKKPHYLSTV